MEWLMLAAMTRRVVCAWKGGSSSEQADEQPSRMGTGWRRKDGVSSVRGGFVRVCVGGGGGSVRLCA
jgi:hypothetical protein